MSTILSSHLRALQLSATVLLVTLGLTALPSFAENTSGETPLDAHAAEYIAVRFQKIGAGQPGLYDNTSIATSAFDFAQYVSNTCYRPTENDLPACKSEFGPYYDLHATLQSGILYWILKGSPVYAGSENLVTMGQPSVSSNEETAKDTVAPEVKTQQDRDERAKMIWEECKQKFGTGHEASACYQRNIRLLTTKSYYVPEKDVESNVY